MLTKEMQPPINWSAKDRLSSLHSSRKKLHGASADSRNTQKRTIFQADILSLFF